MKHWFVRIIVLILTVGMLGACALDGSTNNTDPSTGDSNTTQTESVEEEIIEVTLSKDKGDQVLEEKEIPIEEGAILMDVMKDNFSVEEKGGFITSIQGIGPDEGEEKAWMYFVNDEMAMVGAAEYELSAGDKVTFDLQAWE
ncbi:DUF4430 domain-containing protein [Virgibacillus sp. W0430]|uniref:DUF4430 domain-containing protein n=1 Tax=Virgibacillus sp. W0430 TaxID=3391580 RepID=UPI003F448674